MMEQVTELTTAPTNDADKQPAPLRVLVIDDNEAHAEGLAELLCLAGFEAWHVLTGNEGIESARNLNVDAVLLDMNLPMTQSRAERTTWRGC